MIHRVLCAKWLCAGIAEIFLAIALASAGCSVRASRVTGEGIPCSSDSQCDSGEVCFLGECRGSSTALASVLAEVRSPPGTSYGTSQVGQIDLRTSVIVNFNLQPTLDVEGEVVQSIGPGLQADGGSPVSGANLTFAARNPVIPDRVLQVNVQATSGGDFATRLPVATWDASVVPPPPLPPLYASLGLASSSLALQLLLPAASNLLRVQGGLTAGGVPLAGARVLAVDANGLLLAAAASTDSTGAFQLVLPPGATSFYLRAGPSSDTSAATPSAASLLPNYSAVGPFASAASVAFDYPALPAQSILSGSVIDSSGAAVAGARVYALSLDGQGYVLSNSTTTDTSGAWSLPLLAGMFAVEAAPASGTSNVALSSEIDLPLTAPASSLTITCPRQVQASGLITLADGTTPAPDGTQISATRLPDRLVTSRVAQAQPTVQGKFQIVADVGSYLVVITPPPSSGLPNKTVEIEIDQSTQLLPAISLSQPLEVVGTVSGSTSVGGTTPLAGATIEFFALDAEGVHSLSLGSGLSDSSGHYHAILPDVSQP